MKKLSTLTKAVVIAIGGISFSGMALANGALVSDMVRIDANTPSGSGDTVRVDCGGGTPANGDGETWPDASAKLKINQQHGSSHVEVSVKDARPNTIYTVWLRLKGKDQEGNDFGGSPLTGGGATPLVPGYALDDVVSYSPQSGSPGTTHPTNGFTTDANGKGKLKIDLDFPVLGGAYPFNLIGEDALDTVQVANPSATATPTAIVNPAAEGVDGPFMIRMVSHCQDDLAHGLSPSAREAWFDWPQ